MKANYSDAAFVPAGGTLHCARCGNTWTPMDPERLPKQCPACTSVHWNEADYRRPGPHCLVPSCNETVRGFLTLKERKVYFCRTHGEAFLAEARA